MMLILGFLFSLCFSQSLDFVFNKDVASGDGNDWSWTITRDFTFAPEEEKKFKLNFANIQDGDPTLGDHYEFKATYVDAGQTYDSALDYAFKVTGSLGACTERYDCYSDTTYDDNDCDFDTSTEYTLTAKNEDTTNAQNVRVKFVVSGNNQYCSDVDDVKGWFEDFGRLVLIITIVCLVLCICCIALVCCGVVKCCCMQQQPNTVVVETAKY